MTGHTDHPLASLPENVDVELMAAAAMRLAARRGEAPFPDLSPSEEAEEWRRAIAEGLARGRLEPWQRRALAETRPLVISLDDDSPSESEDDDDEEEEEDYAPPGTDGSGEGAPHYGQTDWPPPHQLSEYDEEEGYFVSPVGSDLSLDDSLASTEGDPLAEDGGPGPGRASSGQPGGPGAHSGGADPPSVDRGKGCGGGAGGGSGCSDSDSGDEASSYKSANDEEVAAAGGGADDSNNGDWTTAEGGLVGPRGRGEVVGPPGGCVGADEEASRRELVRRVVARLIKSGKFFEKRGREEEGGLAGFKEFVPRAASAPQPAPDEPTAPAKTRAAGPLPRFHPSEVDPSLKPYDPPPGRRGSALLCPPPPPPPFLHLVAPAPLYRIKEDGYLGGGSPAAKDPVLSAAASQEYERSYELSERDYYFLRGFPDAPAPPRLHPDLPRFNWAVPPFRLPPETMMKRSFYRCSSRKQLRHVTKY